MVFLRSALLIMLIKRSAPGMADFSSLFRLRPVFFNLCVYPYKAYALTLPIYTISFVNAIVLSKLYPSCASDPSLEDYN